MRKKIIAGNWKMNKTPSEAISLIEEILPKIKDSQADVVLCVPSISIIPAKNAVEGTDIKIGAQNMFFEDQGAYTGELSAEMLLDAGVEYVVLGHSERRQYFGETDEDINKKIKKALCSGLIPIICCGETIEQREQGITLDWIRMQIKKAFYGIEGSSAKKTVVAYEPIWAIGTGKTATAEQAEEVCNAIRKCLLEIYGEEVAYEIRIQYGGSVNAQNAAELFTKSDIDGGLVGGASLKTEFAEIVNWR